MKFLSGTEVETQDSAGGHNLQSNSSDQEINISKVLCILLLMSLIYNAITKFQTIFLKTFYCSKYYNFKQAGAELGQAQFQLS